ncbi:hypothetical protein Vretifemale_14505, partial [Volvox reticuliferus]
GAAAAWCSCGVVQLPRGAAAALCHCLTVLLPCGSICMQCSRHAVQLLGVAAVWCRWHAVPLACVAAGMWYVPLACSAAGLACGAAGMWCRWHAVLCVSCHCRAVLLACGTRLPGYTLSNYKDNINYTDRMTIVCIIHNIYIPCAQAKCPSAQSGQDPRCSSLQGESPTV